MPPSARKKKAIAKADAEQRVDAEAAEAATPSRKRTRAPKDKDSNSHYNAKRTRRASAESDATIDHQQADAMHDEPEYAEAEAIIQRLRCAAYQVTVAIECNNAIVPPNQQAFAKIAGRNWTYYVKQTNVVIGRPNNRKFEMPGPGSEAVAALLTPDAGAGTMQVGIDLGPDHQISRVHADIEYDSDSGEWVIRVNGRNGLHLDDMRLERGQVCTLHSGAVISILGTQMIFILPNEAPYINATVKRLLMQENGSGDEQYQPDDGVPRDTIVRYAGLPPPTYQSGPYLPPASGNGGTQAAQALAALSNATTPSTPRLPPPQPKSKNSPAYAVKGLMLDSISDEIDYSADSAKDIKPPHSYAQMIGQAILSRPEDNATLSQIYEFIKEHYAFFRINGGGWQNSIRHNLSLSKHFEKIPRRTDEPGKGMKWQIVPSFRDEYMKKNFHDALRIPVHRPQYEGGELSSDPVTQTQRLVGAINGESSQGIKRRSGSPTPPRNGYPAPNESYTPDRGPRLQTGYSGTASGVPLSGASETMTTPTFDRTNPLASQQTFSAGSHQSLAADSPPTLSTGLQHDTVNGMMHTPLPARSAPRPFPSTIKPPSFYAKELFSSPAPFWKFANVAGSTPFKMPDLSPDKIARPPIPDDDMKTDEVEDEVDEKISEEEEGGVKEGKGKAKSDTLEEFEEGAAEVVSNVVPPSSPPRTKDADDEAEAPDESPSRTVSRPVSRREPAANSFTNGTTPVLQTPNLAPPPPQPRFSMSTGLGMSGSSIQKYGYYGQSNGDDGSEDEGIDLSKPTFQKIGQYHRVMNAARPAAAPRN